MVSYPNADDRLFQQHSSKSTRVVALKLQCLSINKWRHRSVME